MLPTTFITLFAAVAAAAPSPHIIRDLAVDVAAYARLSPRAGTPVAGAAAAATSAATGGVPANVRGCADTKTDGPVVEHKVVQGDTLSRLTATFQSGICNIAKASNISNPDALSIGVVLKIPTGLCTQNVDNNSCLKQAVPNPNTDAAKTCLKSGPATRVIKAGDTFIGIAKELGLNDNAVLDANPGVDRFNLAVGQVIKLPICK